MKRRMALAALMAALSSAGCAHDGLFRTPLIPETADEVATVTIAPISVSRWDDVYRSLQPSFAMDPAAALTAANPITQSWDQRIAESLQLSLRAALPTSARTTVDTLTEETGEDSQRSRQQVTTEQSGDASVVSAAALPTAAAATLAGLTGDQTFGRDPMLRYLAATAVFQEVNLLNRYVSDAVRPRGAHAYLVRLQLSVVPTRRNLPYDVLSDITIQSPDITPSNPAARLDGCPANEVTVVPLLVTDNLESLTAASSEEASRRLGLAVLATAGNVGLGGDLGSARDAVQASRGYDINSLMTVARLRENMVRVRLGAAYSPTTGFALVPRTHNISLLVLYTPCHTARAKGQAVFNAVMRTTFLDAETGESLRRRSPGEVAAIVVNEISPSYPSLGLTSEDLAALLPEAEKPGASTIPVDWVQATIVRSFAPCRARLPNADVTPPVTDAIAKQNQTRCDAETRNAPEIARRLYSDLLAVRPDGGFSVARIPVELRQLTPSLPPENQRVVISQTATGATAILYGAADVQRAQQLSASLNLRFDGDSVIIPASDVARSADGRSLTVRFPALEPYGLPPSQDELDTIAEGAQLSLIAGWIDIVPDGTAVTRTYGDIVLTSLPQQSPPARSEGGPTPAYSISVGAAMIVTDGAGRGRLNIAYSAGEGSSLEPVRLAITGADITGQTKLRGSALEAGADGWSFAGAGETTLALENLQQGQSVTLTVVSVKTGKPMGSAVIRAVVNAARDTPP